MYNESEVSLAVSIWVTLHNVAMVLILNTHMHTMPCAQHYAMQHQQTLP